MFLESPKQHDVMLANANMMPTGWTGGVETLRDDVVATVHLHHYRLNCSYYKYVYINIYDNANGKSMKTRLANNQQPGCS